MIFELVRRMYADESEVVRVRDSAPVRRIALLSLGNWRGGVRMDDYFMDEWG